MDPNPGLKTAILTRSKALSGDDGTFGHIVTPSGNKYCSGELPNRNNLRNRSCINPSKYHVKNLWSEHHKRNLWHILGVDGHDNIEIHSGNLCGDVDMGYASDVLGCQLYGDSIAMFREGEVVEGHHLTRDQRGVTNTVATLKKLMAELGDEFFLDIREE